MSSGPPLEDACSIVTISFTTTIRRAGIRFSFPSTYSRPETLGLENKLESTAGTVEIAPSVQRFDLQVAPVATKEEEPMVHGGRSGSDQILRACNQLLYPPPAEAGLRSM
ncbi:PREDICTED: uncharacterized protein LOC105462697 [Wasmannia auropunctata]|uniref:uncharacterized protein LOC105462697 n=1 Tax=Wasmannia auropunctata TaxID=64793 RepID=UPI0005EEB5ED|nr:PREDICTED: uncharacterized protein LOC105462697 [Wasmannia auropunctata]